MGVTDGILATGIVAAALAILYRFTWKSGGKCAGCSGGCAPKQRSDLVRLGAPGPRPGGPAGRASQRT